MKIPDSDQKSKISDIKRGDVVLVNLEPAKGSEQGGVRPALIIQNDLGNKYSSTTIISPITSKIPSKEYPFHVKLLRGDGGLERDSTILLDQIRTIDKLRIMKKLGQIDAAFLKKVDLAVRISFGLE